MKVMNRYKKVKSIFGRKNERALGFTLSILVLLGATTPPAVAGPIGTARAEVVSTIAVYVEKIEREIGGEKIVIVDVTAADVKEQPDGKKDGDKFGNADHEESFSFAFGSTSSPGSGPLNGAIAIVNTLAKADPTLVPSWAWSEAFTAGNIFVTNKGTKIETASIFVKIRADVNASTTKPGESASSSLDFDIFWDGESIIKDTIDKSLRASCPNLAMTPYCFDQDFIDENYFVYKVMQPGTTYTLRIDPAARAEAAPEVGTIPLILTGIGMLGLRRRISRKPIS